MVEPANNDDELHKSDKDQDEDVPKGNQQTEDNLLDRPNFSGGDLIQRLGLASDWIVNFDNRASKTIQHIIDQANEYLQSSIFNLTNKISETLQTFYKFAEYLEKLYEDYEITQEQAVEILRKYRWFFSPSMPVTFVAKVVEVGNKNGNQRGVINALFIGYYSQNNYRELTELVHSWSNNPLFKPRMKILLDCVRTLKLAHSRLNPANVVLPTLIAQLDGILTDYTAKHQRNPQFKSQFRQLTQNEYQPELVNDVLLELLFQKAIAGQPLAVPFIFNRHKIMHGEYIRYGRMEHVIRTFLLLDFLAHLPLPSP